MNYKGGAMSEIVVTRLFYIAMTALLTSVWYRLGGLKELKRDMEEFKTHAYKNFIDKETCDLKQKACINDKLKAS